MNVLLFGVTCVGKTAVGRKLSEKLGWKFYDIDEETKKSTHMSKAQFQKYSTIEKRDRIRGRLISALIENPDDKVIAVSVLNCRKVFAKFIGMHGVLPIELIDTPENIYKRIVFSDINDEEYWDDQYTKAHRKELIDMLSQEVERYGRIYSIIPHRLDVRGNSVDTVAERIIRIYDLKR